MPGAHRIHRFMRFAAAVSFAAVLAVACAPAGNPPTLPVRAVSVLVTQIVAGGNDAGRMASVALAQDGTPVVSYLLLKPTLPAGQLPPAVVPNTAQPPAVVVAAFSTQHGYWSRTSASPQDYAKGVGTDTSIATKDGKYLPGVNTAVAVDGQDKVHVVWATPTGLFYTDDTTSAAFADPDPVTTDATSGASIAIGSDGTPYVAYYDGSDVSLATKTSGKWTIQVIDATAPCTTCPNARTAIRMARGTTPVVAYTAGRTAVVEVVKPGAFLRQIVGQSGFGISLALGKDGVGYAAYYTEAGGVNVAISPGPAEAAGAWTEKPAAAAPSASPSSPETSAWSTGIGVDDSGKLYVTWADPATGLVQLASGPPTGAPKIEPVPQSVGGQNPALAVSADGKSLELAFHDGPNHQLAVAMPSVGGIALGMPSPTASPPPTAASGPPCSPTSDSTALTISALNTAFDTNCLAVVPDAAFTVAFNNGDNGVPHNWDLFKDAGYAQHIGGGTAAEAFPGVASQTYDLTALPAGIYYFRCDVHPTIMLGFLVVAAVGPQPGPSSSP